MVHRVLYFGFGANREVAVLAEVLGKSPDEMVGSPASLKGYELVIQSIPNIPSKIVEKAPVKISPRAMMSRVWGDGFQSYSIRRQDDSSVSGTIWVVTTDESKRIEDWELTELGWNKRRTVRVYEQSGIEVDVYTDVIDDSQPFDRVVDGTNYVTFLNDIVKSLQVARKARQAYDERQLIAK